MTLTTADFPEGDPGEVIREHYGKIGQRVEITPDEDVSFHLHATAMLLPGLMLGHGSASAMQATRTRAMRSDGAADILLSFQPAGSVVSDGDDHTVVAPGDLAVTALDRPITLHSSGQSSSFLTLQMSRQALAPLIPGLDALATRSLSIEAPGARLLRTFAGNLTREALPGPQECDLAARHLLEMAALVLGSTADGRAQAAAGGLRAARLSTARTLILKNLASPTLSAAGVAHDLGVSTRYLHKLFETEPLSFAQFVTEHRLACAMRTLTDPAHRHRKILDIALQAGFGDVTTFNRAFRRRFGASPSDCRAGRGGGAA